MKMVKTLARIFLFLLLLTAGSTLAFSLMSLASTAAFYFGISILFGLNVFVVRFTPSLVKEIIDAL